MSTQQQVKPQPKKATPDETRQQAEEDAVKQAQAKRDTSLTHTDELLDEIDELLEENAEEFVLNYRQKGGQ